MYVFEGVKGVMSEPDSVNARCDASIHGVDEADRDRARSDCALSHSEDEVDELLFCGDRVKTMQIPSAHASRRQSRVQLTIFIFFYSV